MHGLQDRQGGIGLQGGLFLDGMLLLYTIASFSPFTPTLPNPRADCPKAAWRPQGLSWPGGLCRRWSLLVMHQGLCC